MNSTVRKSRTRCSLIRIEPRCTVISKYAITTIFALGHVATVHLATRLAVFFPALLFGWLRARTGGVGASVALHALCNLFAAYLARSYGFAR